MTQPLLPFAMVQSGDLLAWKGDQYKAAGDLLIKGVCLVTRETYGHVGIAWRTHDGLDDELLVIEATIPKIRISRITPDKELYCVPMGVVWGNKNKAFLVNKIGLPYGLMDAVRAGLGKKVERDDRWQCAELSHAFYHESNIRLPKEYTPGALVRNAAHYTSQPVFRVVTPTKL